MNNSKTASQSKETIQAIDGITDVLNTALGIDGIVTTSVTLLKDSLAGEKTSLYSIINTNLTEITKATVSIANIVASIASVMTGESVSPDTKSVITKVSKKSIYGETPLTEFLEKSAKKYSDESKKQSANASLELIVQGIDKDGMEGFIKVVEALSKEYKTDTKLLTSLNKGMVILTSVSDNIDKMNLDNFNKTTVNKAIAFSNTISSIFSVTELKPGKLDVKQLKKNIDGLTDIANKLITDGTLTSFDNKHSKSIINFIGAITLLATLSENDNIDDLKDTLKSLNKSLDTLNIISNSISSIDLTVFNEDLVKNINSFRDMVVVLSTLTSLETKSLQKVVKQILDSMPDLIATATEAGTLISIIKNSFKGKGLESLIKFFDDLELALKSAVKAGTMSKAAAKSMPSIKKALDVVKDIVQIVIDADIPNINKSKVNNITNAKDIMEGISSIMIAGSLCALLCIPGMIGLFVIKVTAKLLVKILNSIMSDFSNIDSGEINAQFKSIGILLVTIGLVMLVACLTGGFIGKNIGNIFMFGLGLMIMLTMVLLPLRLFKSAKDGEDPIGTAKAAAILIATCSIVMMLGALFMLTGLAGQALLFGVTLMAFITLVMLPIALMSLFMKDVSKTLEVAVKMIITCTVIMVLGALFMLTGLWKESLLFGVVLMAFITMVLLPIVIASLFMKDIEGTLAKLTVFVVVCTLILMVGAWFMTTGLWLEAILFGVILMLFIGMVLAPFVIFGKKLQKQIPTLLTFAAFVAICAGVLMIGAWFIKKHDPGGKNTLIFAAILVGFVGLMSLCIKLLSKIPKKELMMGSAAMAVISGVTVVAAFAMKILAEASKIADMKKLLGIVGIMIAIIVSIGGLSVALGALATIPFTAPFFWAGLGAMAAVAGIALVFSAAIKNIAEAIAVLATVDQNGGIDEARIMGLIGTIPVIGNAVAAAGIALPTGLIIRTSIACMSMAMMISKIGKAVADISNLIVGTKWDSDGNPIEFRQLNETDFVNAANNIQKIVTTLGAAIIAVYDLNPDIFKVPEVTVKSFWGTKKVSGKKTKFQMVVEACSSLGTMISLIGAGVRDFANMKVATEWNSDGSPKSYRNLTDNDFTSAAKNIQKIITTLGASIIAIYDLKKDMFEVPMVTVKTWWGGTRKVSGSGPTIFEKVVRACSSMGTMITMLAQGVFDFASMQIATKWNDEGKPIEYRKLTDGEIGDAINNIQKVILSTFSALKWAYTFNKDIFDAKLEWVNGHLVSTVPVYRVISAGMLAGKMVSSLAQGVFDVANLRIATKWNKEGVAIDYREMTDTDFENYNINVNRIICSTFEALMFAYSKHPEWYDSIEVTSTKDGLFTSSTVTFKKDSPLKSIIQAAQGAGGLISELAQGANDIMNMYIKDSNGKRVPIDINDLKVGGKLHKAVEGIVTGVMQALIYAYDNTRSGATDAMEWTTRELREKVVPAMDSVKKLATTAAEAVEQLKKSPVTASTITWFIKFTLTPIMNSLIYAYDSTRSGATKAMEWTTSIMEDVLPGAIENACKLQKIITKNAVSTTDSALATNLVSLMENTTKIINGLASVYYKTPSGVTKKMQWTKDILVSEVIPSIENAKAVQKTLNNFTVGDNTEKIANFETLVLGLYTPLAEVKPREIKKFSTTFSNKNVNNITTLVKTVNTLNTNKADKFIQMIAELRQLSLSIKDMPKFIALLDQKLTESLSVLSDRIDSASTVLQDSDKMQQERQSKIEDNAKLLKEMLQTPIKLELFKEDTGNGEGADDFGFDGDMETGGSVDTGGSMDTGGSSNLTGLVQKIARKLGAI